MFVGLSVENPIEVRAVEENDEVRFRQSRVVERLKKL